MNTYKPVNVQKGYGIFFISLLLSLLTSACANLAPTANNKNAPATYTLTPELAEQKPVDTKGPIITIYQPRVNAIFDSPRIAYSQEPYSVAYYAYNEWVASPGHMLEPLIRESIERSGYFSSVVPSSSRNFADLAIDTELVNLLHQYKDENSYGDVKLHLQLIDLKQRKIIATHTFEDSVAARTNDPDGAINALNMAVERILKQLAEFAVLQAQVPR